MTSLSGSSWVSTASLPLALFVAVGCVGTDDETLDSVSQQVTFDPTRSYDDRILLFELLQDELAVPPGWSDERDGILLQTIWQRDSDRDQVDGSGRLNTWWPNINWTLSIWQVEALQRRGELADVVVTGFQDARFALPDSVAADVHRLYDELAIVRADVIAGRLSPEQDREARRRIRRLLWGFHVNAIHTGLARNDDMLAQLPDGERDFAESWGKTVVDLLAIVNFPTDETTVHFFQNVALPPRVLRADDFNLTAPSDLSLTTRTAIIAMRTIHRFEVATGGRLKRLIELFVNSEAREVRLQTALQQAITEGGERAVSIILKALSPFASLERDPQTTCSDAAGDLSCEMAELTRIEAELVRTDSN
jgi:hypothetical protein